MAEALQGPMPAEEKIKWQTEVNQCRERIRKRVQNVETIPSLGSKRATGIGATQNEWHWHTGA